MPLWGRKPAPPTPAPAPAPAIPAGEPDTAAPIVTPEDIPDIEKRIDFFVTKGARRGVMDRFEARYGERLEPPSPTAGFRFTEVELLDAPSAGAAGSPATASVAGEGTSATVSAGGIDEGTGAVHVTSDAEPGSSDQPVAAEPAAPRKPLFVRPLPPHPLGHGVVRRGLACGLFSISCFPFYKYARYRSDSGWLPYLFLFLFDIPLFIFPNVLFLLVKLLVGGPMDLMRKMRRSREAAEAAQLQAMEAAAAEQEQAAAVGYASQ